MAADPLVQIQEAVIVIDRTDHLTPPAGKEKQHWLLAASQLDAIAKDLPPAMSAALRYHQARYCARAEDKVAAIKLLEALPERPLLPEALSLKMQLTHIEGDIETYRRRWQVEDTLGAALPLSAWGNSRDGRLYQKEAQGLGHALKLNPDWPLVPRIERAHLLEIAKTFADLRVIDEAANAYREALYCGFMIPQFLRPHEDSWFSVSAAEHWMSLARLEASLRRTNWSVQAMLLAVACAPKQTIAAKQVLEQLTQAKMQVVPPQPDEAKFRRIADLYAQCLVHPRGDAALNQATALLPKADFAAQRRALAADWGKLMNDYTAGRRETAVLFGQLVGKAKDPITLIPSRFPYEAK